MAVSAADADVRAVDSTPPPTPPPPVATSWWRRLLPPALMLVTLAVGVGLPLLYNTGFYYWDDSAAVAVPWYRRIAADVLAGQFPALQLDMWRGGNLAAEAATGVWNPVVLGAAIATLQIQNLAVAITVMKAVFLAVMAGGVYLLCRVYGATAWPAAAVGAALPLAGYTLFVDATSWVNGLLVAAFTPWVWWSARRAVQRRRSFVWVVLTGYLCGSVGNPYGMLTAAVVIAAVAVEGGVTGKLRRLPGLAVAGLAVVAANVVVYLPFVLTSPVTYRSSSSETQVGNSEFLSPSLTDLLAASTPDYQPWMKTWGLPYWTVPVTYMAWFLLPLLPWVRWRQVRGRALTGVWIVGGLFLLAVLGPTQIWMFRWPLRLVGAFALPVGVLFAVLASGPRQRGATAARTAISAATVLVGGYLAWSSMPEQLGRHLLAVGVAGALVAAAVAAWPARPAGFAVLAAGTLGVLALQLSWFPANNNVANYRFPSSERLLEQRFADRYQGLTVQVADIGQVAAGDLTPDGAYTDLLFGSLYSLAGVESLTAYSGIGFNDMDATFCIAYQGSMTCPQAWDRLWEHPAGFDVPLADLLRAQTVVVQNRLIDTRGVPAPPGWWLAERDERVAVWRRSAPLPWAQGRLSHPGAGVVVPEDRRVGPAGERLRVQRSDPSGPATLTFARLAWPGYTAELDGRALRLSTGPAGLLQAELPVGSRGGELVLSFTPPGFGLGLQAMAVAAGLTALLVLAQLVGALRRRASGQNTRTTAREEGS